MHCRDNKEFNRLEDAWRADTNRPPAPRMLQGEDLHDQAGGGFFSCCVSREKPLFSSNRDKEWNLINHPDLSDDQNRTLFDLVHTLYHIDKQSNAAALREVSQKRL